VGMLVGKGGRLGKIRSSSWVCWFAAESAGGAVVDCQSCVS
jgi:hypothetical protein